MRRHCKHPEFLPTHSSTITTLRMSLSVSLRVYSKSTSVLCSSARLSPSQLLLSARALPRFLRDHLIAVSIVPLLTVGEEPVDDDAADGEDEDQDRPQELVADRAA